MARVDMQKIGALARALYGEHWQRALAQQLEVNPCTIGRWRKGIGSPTAKHARALLFVAEGHISLVKSAHDELLSDLRYVPLPPTQIQAPAPDPNRPWWTRPWSNDPSALPAINAPPQWKSDR
jgi:hypothetical protein